LEYRPLGRTSEKIPIIGMGTWKMGSSRKAERAEEINSLRRGLELGMTMIDTAESYGDGDSERLVSEAIRGKRDSVFVASKVRPRNLHHDDVLAACEQSLMRLGTSYIDL